MSLREHPVWEEELMPYVDGQLDATKASAIAQHLETCEVCATAVADARGMSQQMTAWKVEDFSEEQSKRVLDELRVGGKEQAISAKMGVVDSTSRVGLWSGRSLCSGGARCSRRGAGVLYAIR